MRKRKPKWLRKWLRQEKKAKGDWSEYQSRNKILKELGFANYSEYLKSELWKKIRTRRFAISNSCCCCENKADVIHHDKYYRKILLGDEESIKRDLYPLCNSCHRKIEFDSLRKRSSAEAVRVFRRMLYKFKNGISKSQMIRNKLANK